MAYIVGDDIDRYRLPTALYFMFRVACQLLYQNIVADVRFSIILSLYGTQTLQLFLGPWGRYPCWLYNIIVEGHTTFG